MITMCIPAWEATFYFTGPAALPSPCCAKEQAVQRGFKSVEPGPSESTAQLTDYENVP